MRTEIEGERPSETQIPPDEGRGTPRGEEYEWCVLRTRRESETGRRGAAQPFPASQLVMMDRRAGGRRGKRSVHCYTFVMHRGGAQLRQLRHANIYGCLLGVMVGSGILRMLAGLDGGKWCHSMWVLAPPSTIHQGEASTRTVLACMQNADLVDHGSDKVRREGGDEE